VRYGASPRASIGLALASRAHALLRGRTYVTPDDVQAICRDVMRHRIGLTYEAEADDLTVEQVLGEILSRVPVP
jgi:MoxR-like ATPase